MGTATPSPEAWDRSCLWLGEPTDRRASRPYLGFSGGSVVRGGCPFSEELLCGEGVGAACKTDAGAFGEAFADGELKISRDAGREAAEAVVADGAEWWGSVGAVDVREREAETGRGEEAVCIGKGQLDAGGQLEPAGCGEVGAAGGVFGDDDEAGEGVAREDEVGAGPVFEGGVAGEVEGADYGVRAAADAAGADKAFEGGHGECGEDADDGDDDEQFDERECRV
jgi:hypothetical protein